MCCVHLSENYLVVIVIVLLYCNNYMRLWKSRFITLVINPSNQRKELK